MKDGDLKLKLDLHTHCFEANGVSEPTITIDIVKDIVAAVKARGLDGVAITEHYGKAYGYKVKEMVDHYFSGEILVIPGQEVAKGSVDVVELYLPGDVTFRFIVHPGYPCVRDLASQIDNSIHGIELRNALHEIDESRVREVAEKYNLLLLTNSDAHHLSNIGQYYNEIDIEELCARVR